MKKVTRQKKEKQILFLIMHKQGVMKETVRNSKNFSVDLGYESLISVLNKASA
jgi:hypothetical protein